MKKILLYLIVILFCCCGEEVSDRDRFLGQYNVSEFCENLGDFEYEISIVASSESEDKIEIMNFADFRLALTATVVGSNINFDVILSGIDARIEGSGSLTDDELIINYNLTNQYQDILGNTFTDSCTKTASKIVR